MRLRAGAPGDLAAILSLYNHYVTTSPSTFETEPVTPEERSDWLAEHSGGGPYRILIAEDDNGALLGWASTSPFRPRAAYATTVEASVYARPDAVGRRIGSALYDALFRAIADQDVERIVAGIVVPNPASIALHRRFGFRLVGTFTRVGRKFGQYWDVAWYERPRILGEDEATPGARGAGWRAPGGPPP